MSWYRCSRKVVDLKTLRHRRAKTLPFLTLFSSAEPKPPPVVAENVASQRIASGKVHSAKPIFLHPSFSIIKQQSEMKEEFFLSKGRHKSSLVRTTETTPATPYAKSFCEWLAGIIDGDGSIQVDKEGCTSLEITMGFENLRLLRHIQDKLGGGIKMRAGGKSYRYRLRHHLGVIKVMNCINGHIRHSARLPQLHRVCQELKVPVILPIPMDAKSNWFAGFFDAQGSITMAMKNGLPQLNILVTNRRMQDVESYKAVFGGSIYFDSGRNGYYQWSIQSRNDVIIMLDYFKSNTFRGHESRRFFLIEEYYRLYDLEAFKPDSIYHKAWLAFLDKWNKGTAQYTSLKVENQHEESGNVG